jgi:hypothetical protein
MTEGRFAPDGKSVIFNAPEMEGVECEVQHSVRSGKGFCPTPGLCGVGVVTLPTGPASCSRSSIRTARAYRRR